MNAQIVTKESLLMAATDCTSIPYTGTIMSIGSFLTICAPQFWRLLNYTITRFSRTLADSVEYLYDAYAQIYTLTSSFDGKLSLKHTYSFLP